MTSDPNSFATALARHVDGGRLRAAFDACNRSPDLERYDRTTLSRWLSGSIPSRGDFVATLAQKLGDLGLYEAWLDSRRGPSTADVKAVVTRFQGLPGDLKDDAFEQIRDSYTTTSRNVRSQFTMRIELHDSDDDAYRFKTTIEMNWIGSLPPIASLMFVTDDWSLTNAYEHASCIFREMLGSDQDQLIEIFSSGEWQQVLSYLPTSTQRSRAEIHRGSMVNPGTYEFQNEGVDQASIMLRVEYPVLRGVPIFPVLFKGYQVSGPVAITFALYSHKAHAPRVFPFVGLGRNWIVNEKELVLEAGMQGAMLGTDTGVIFYWSESD